LGELLLDYIVDLLEESVAEEVEDHLLDCAYCEERYQTILNIRSASRRKTRGAEGEQVLQPERAAGGAKVLKLAEFRKRLH
jgi:anti-sigma factor RsiW